MFLNVLIKLKSSTIVLLFIIGLYLEKPSIKELKKATINVIKNIGPQSVKK